MSPMSTVLSELLDAGCADQDESPPPLTAEDRVALLEELDRFGSMETARRIKVVHVLGRAAEPAAVTRLRALLPSMSVEERMTTAIALARIGTPGAFTALRELKDDPSPDVRRMAVNAFGRVKSAAAIDVLGQIRDQDPSPLVRDHAARMLRFLADQ